MTVYVDELIDYQKRIGRAGPFWCHLVADTESELHMFATRLRLDRSYAQHAGKPTAHYDLTRGKRIEAIRRGAVEITNRELAERISASIDQESEKR